MLIAIDSASAGDLLGRSDAIKPRNRKLDIVIAHYNMENIAEAVETWSEVLNRTYVQAMSPHIFLYCQNEASTEPDLAWFADHGEVIHIPNLGRESHAYLWHIVYNYGNLALHTLFHQDVSHHDKNHVANKLSLLTPETGMLALSHIGMCTCDTCFLKEIPKLRDLWAMSQHTFCSPYDTYPVFLKGAFVVSSRRIMNVGVTVYKVLLQYLEAPADHWIHKEHKFKWARTPDNPIFGHVMERARNIVFDCMHLTGPAECQLCNSDCKKFTASACQCLDPAV